MKEKKNRIKKDLFNGIVCKEGNRQTAGITLIALIITIIILLILAGITIATLSNSGLFSKTQEAKETWNNAQSDEKEKIARYENEIEDILGSRGEIKPTLVWTNPSPNSNFDAQTIAIDLSRYKYAIVVVKDWPPGDEDRTAGIMKINASVQCSISASNTNLMREFSATSTGVQVSTAHSAAATSQSDRVIPMFIYGVESDLELDI